MPEKPPSPVPLRSAVAPRNVRIAAFVAICSGGLLGWFIGFAFASIQVSGNTTTIGAIGGFIGAVAGALGIAVVATLVMRAMNEWRSIERGVNPRTGESFRERDRSA